ncbi:sugar phosphate nucleotidyltransferase [Streptomyces sp. WG5]|uniref:sugar phosphate nucleotidyltransferase n=1 Tax=Streptomyces sp. WG5 TaxID=3417648 RepID=UPI003CF274EB
MKALVVPAEGPVLRQVLRGIADAGVVDVGVVVAGPDDGVKAEAGDGSRFGISITYLPEQPGQAGTIGAVRSARDWLADDDFVLCAGDGFPPGGIVEPLEEFRVRRPAAQIMAARAPGPSSWDVYFFTSALHTAVEAVQRPAAGGDGLSDALQWLYDKGLAVTVCSAEPDGAGSAHGAAGAGPAGG